MVVHRGGSCRRADRLVVALAPVTTAQFKFGNPALVTGWRRGTALLRHVLWAAGLLIIAAGRTCSRAGSEEQRLRQGEGVDLVVDMNSAVDAG